MILVNEEKCIGCGKCVKDCFPRALVMENGKAKQVDAPCIECGHCIAVCPKNAIALEGYDMTQVLELKDINCEIDPEAYLNHMKARRSIRKFKQEPVTDTQLEYILEAGRYSATGSNRQDVRYHVIRDNLDEMRELLMEEMIALGSIQGPIPLYQKVGRIAREYKETGNDRVFFGAPVAIVITSPSPQSALLAAGHMESMIYAQGLGMLYSGYVNFTMNQSEKMRNYMNFKEGYQPWAVMIVGVPDVTYERTAPRKPLDVSWH